MHEHPKFLDLQVAVARFENSVDEFLDAEREALIPFKGPSLNLWKPPQPGRLLINVDASLGGGRSAWAMIVRNHLGELIFLASRWGDHQPPQVAENKAFAWADNFASNMGWREVDWQSDAQLVIKQVTNVVEPERWDSRNDILFLQHLSNDYKG